MEALTVELRGVAPDLVRQFATARPTVRRNSGFGVFTEVAFDPNWMGEGQSGDFGAVYAMVGTLADPIAFTARLQDGRLVGLSGDSYGQDTRTLDFASVHVSQVFTVDASGQSIPFQSAALHTPESAPPPSRPRPQAPVPTAQVPPARVRVARPDDFQAVVQAARQSSDALRTSLADAARNTASSAEPAPAQADGVTVLIGAWTVLAVVALFIGLATDIPWPALFIAVFWIGAALRKPKALAGLQDFVSGWNTARPGAAAWKSMGDR